MTVVTWSVHILILMCALYVFLRLVLWFHRVLLCLWAGRNIPMSGIIPVAMKQRGVLIDGEPHWDIEVCLDALGLNMHADIKGALLERGLKSLDVSEVCTICFFFGARTPQLAKVNWEFFKQQPVYYIECASRIVAWRLVGGE